MTPPTHRSDRAPVPTDSDPTIGKLVTDASRDISTLKRFLLLLVLNVTLEL